MNLSSIKARMKELAGRMFSMMEGIFRGKSPVQGKKNLLMALYIAIVLLVNIAGLTLNFRWDLTRNHTFSLSHKSREIVSHLKEKLKIKVLFSHNLPAQQASVLRYLTDLVEEYNYYGNEYFSYEIIGAKDLEKQASDYGIQPVQIQEIESDQVKVRRAYMGLVIQQSDLVEKVNSISDPTGLEYKITSLIEKISSKIDGLLSLTQPIQVILYLDGGLKNLPIEGIGTLDKKVKEAVDKCNFINYDKLQFRLLDPSVDRTAAVSAEMYGIAKLTWSGGRDRTGKAVAGGEAYMGILLKNRDKSEVIDLSVAPTLFGKNVIVGLDKLEDRINKAVGVLVSSNPGIGYITGHDEVNLDDQQSGNGGAYLRQVLSDVYEIREIDLSKDDIPSDIGLIVINGPKKEFSEAELYKIDQFLMKGNSAIFFLDSFNEVNTGRQSPFGGPQPLMVPIHTGLEKLLGSYGITVDRNLVLDKSCAKGRVAGAIKDIYYVPIIKRSGMQRNSVITKYLKGMAFVKASSIAPEAKKIKAERLSYDSLVSSSDESWDMERDINLNPLFMMPPRNKADMKRYTLAALLSGRFQSYFKNRDVAAAADEANNAKGKGIATVSPKLDATIQAGSTKIIVVGTSEITKSWFLMNAKQIISSSASEADDQGRIFANGFFIHSMADYLTGNSYIPEMSSKSLDYNPLEKTGAVEKVALKTINIAGVPLLLVLAGLFIWRHRLSRKRGIEESFLRGRSNE
jgi:ABC-2 type transport system permease protein